MRLRLIECLKAYSPDFRVGRGGACELDETYFPCLLYTSDIGSIRVAFEPSYEPTGPFGAKSIGEVVINTCLLYTSRCV